MSDVDPAILHELGAAMSCAAQTVGTWADANELGEDRDVVLGVAGQLSSGGEIVRGWAATMRHSGTAPDLSGMLDEIDAHLRTLDAVGAGLDLPALAGRVAELR